MKSVCDFRTEVDRPHRFDGVKKGQYGATDASEASALLIELQATLDVVSDFGVPHYVLGVVPILISET